MLRIITGLSLAGVGAGYAVDHLWNSTAGAAFSVVWFLLMYPFARFLYREWLALKGHIALLKMEEQKKDE